MSEETEEDRRQRLIFSYLNEYMNTYEKREFIEELANNEDLFIELKIALWVKKVKEEEVRQKISQTWEKAVEKDKGCLVFPLFFITTTLAIAGYLLA